MFEPSNSFSSKEITIYHGSEFEIEKPIYGKGKKYNDYGLGFYLTESKLLSGEWAVLYTGRDGYINEYTIDLCDLKVLDLDTLPVESWVSVLITNRIVSLEIDNPEIIKEFSSNYLIDINKYDVIKGWRADDAYFNYIEAFLKNGLSLETLEKAFRFGNLGTQVCLKSKRAFDRIKYVKSEEALVKRYSDSAKGRDKVARDKYYNMRDRFKGTLLSDILRRE